MTCMPWTACMRGGDILLRTSHVLDVLHVHDAHIDACLGPHCCTQAAARIGQRQIGLLQQDAALRVHERGLAGRQPVQAPVPHEP